MDLVVFTYEQTKTLFLITEEEALVLALELALSRGIFFVPLR